VVIRNGSGKAKESPFYNADGQLLPYRFDGFKPVRLERSAGRSCPCIQSTWPL
jgi:hypothetical protein